MKSNLELIAPLAGLLLLGGCGMVDGQRDAATAGSAPVAASAVTVDPPVKLGEPYQIGGRTFTPADVVDYDDVGFASVYGRDTSGPTALGEAFRPDAVSAAHPTLPLPSYVEVTALDSGRTILVRVNDRGPFVANRIIDLSPGAAAQLGLDGVQPVRVRRVSPPEGERAALRAGQPAVERLATPDSLLAVLRRRAAALAPDAAVGAAAPASSAVRTAAPPPASSVRPATGGDRFIVEGAGQPSATASTGQPVRRSIAAATDPVGKGSQYAVQIGAFSNEGRARTLARQAGGNVVRDGQIWRVRLGPYDSAASAQAAQQAARSKGYTGARVVKAD